MNGKGDRPRPGVYSDAYRRNYDAIFRPRMRTLFNPPPRKLTAEELGKLADHLIGTCKSLPQGIADLEFKGDVDEGDAESRLSSLKDMRVCEGCGWWTDEAGWMCSDCEQEQEEEDEEERLRQEEEDREDEADEEDDED